MAQNKGSTLSPLLDDELLKYSKAVKATRSHAERSGHAYSRNLFRKSGASYAAKAGEGCEESLSVIRLISVGTYGAV
jgi:hypothetical protein